MIKKFLTGLLISLGFLTITTTPIKADSTKPYENRWQLVLSEDECMDIAKITELEYGNGSYEARCAVIETILNRVVDERFPDTVEGVISAPHQFSTYRRIDKCTPKEDTYNCVLDVLNGKTDILPMDYVFFNNKPIGREIIQIGGHYHGK